VIAIRFESLPGIELERAEAISRMFFSFPRPPELGLHRLRSGCCLPAQQRIDLIAPDFGTKSRMAMARQFDNTQPSALILEIKIADYPLSPAIVLENLS